MKVFGIKLTKTKAQILLMVGLCIFCPFLTSSAGIYYVGFFDDFITNIPFSLGALTTYYLFVHKFPFS